MQPYTTSQEHLLEELERVDLHIRLQVRRARKIKQIDDRFEGLYISDQEVDALTAGPAGLPRWATAEAAWSEVDADRAFERIEHHIAARRLAGVLGGPRLRLDDLAAVFELDRCDIDALLITLAPEIDLRYERLFAYLHDDVTRRRPSVDLALNLLCRSLPEKIAARARFIDPSPLARHRLVELIDDPARPSPSLLGKLLKVDDHIAQFLLGAGGSSHALAPHARWVHPDPSAPPLVAPPALRARMDRLVALAEEGPIIAYFHGPGGAGKRSWAEALAARLGAPVLVVDGDRLAASKDASVDVTARLAAREASLHRAVLCWTGFDALSSAGLTAERDALAAALSARGGVNVVTGQSPWEPPMDRGAIPWLSVAIERPSYAERVEIWSRSLGDLGAALSGEIQALSDRFRLTGGEIAAAAASARVASRWSEVGAPIAAEDLYAACRARSSRRLGELAHKIVPRAKWGDIVLPHEARRQLHEIGDRVRHRSRVLEGWGFEAKLSSGKGLNAVFAGPSGTGKTMAAEIMAGELGLELYKIDLSGVVSKYIGETEKNLSRIFAEAESANAILFFDEADALFGKRSEVKDAHDRYANIETGYLLQRMEEHEGVAILATNLRRNMDEAFVRRMAFVITFPFPEEQERLAIWGGIFPKETPLGDDIDLPFLARQFKLSGGNIKNVALAAAFLAASAGEAVVSMRHLARATRRELQKMGTSFVPAELGPYAVMLEEG